MSKGVPVAAESASVADATPERAAGRISPAGPGPGPSSSRVAACRLASSQTGPGSPGVPKISGIRYRPSTTKKHSTAPSWACQPTAAPAGLVASVTLNAPRVPAPSATMRNEWPGTSTGSMSRAATTRPDASFRSSVISACWCVGRGVRLQLDRVEGRTRGELEPLGLLLQAAELAVVGGVELLGRIPAGHVH